MEFKYCKIDPETCTLDELRAEIERIKLISDENNNNQLGAKTFIKSVYGALANQYYSLSNTDIAESITLQGQDLIKYAVNVVNWYFKEKWHIDTDTHRKIAAAMKNEYPDFDVDEFMTLCSNRLQFGETLQCAGDTDSAYISFQPLVDALSIPIDRQTKFLMFMYENFLEGYLTMCFDEYAKKFNCPESLEEFALEKIFRSGIFLAKKKYTGDIAWKEPDIFVNPLHKIVYKGIEVIQGSTPKFCRDAMKGFIKFMLDRINKHEDVDYKEIVANIRAIKTRFVLQSPDDMCKTFNVNDYEKYILEDKQTIVLNDAASVPLHVRGSAVYNNTLFNKGKRWKSKYSMIRKGDKVKLYYIKDDRIRPAGEPDPVFSFLPNDFPTEFAAPIDTDIMFEKLILDPLNRIVVACGYRPVPSTLTYASSLF